MKRSALALLIVAAAPEPAASASLSYPSSPEAVLGSNYVARLTEDKDASGQAAVLVLSLERRSPTGTTNLLEPAGRWHGTQPFLFMARDFKTKTPIYSRSLRFLAVKGTRQRLRVVISGANVGRGASWTGGALKLKLSLVSN